jgi:hypothetical protein
MDERERNQAKEPKDSQKILEEILEKLKKRDRDWWDKFQISSSTFIALLLAIVTIVSAYLTYSTNRNQIDLQREEAEIKQQELLIAKLKHVEDLIPLLKKDTLVRLYFSSQVKDSIYQMLGFDFKSITSSAELRNNTKPNDSTNQQIIGIAKSIQPDSVSSRRTPGWVWLGQRINNKWSPKNFGFTKPPRLLAGSTIFAATATWKRTAKPIQNPSNLDEWKLGEIISVVKENNSVTVVEVDSLADDNWWAYVK